MPLQQIKKILSIISYYVVPASLLAVSLLVSEKESNHVFGLMGNVAGILLGFILFIKPLSEIFTRITVLRIIVAFRRQLGVACFWFALFHGALYIQFYELYKPEFFTEKLYLFGLISLVGMVALGLTSNNFALKKLGKNWKRLHRITYILLFTVLYHVYQTEGELFPPLFIGSVFIILKFLAWKDVTYPPRQKVAE